MELNVTYSLPIQDSSAVTALTYNATTKELFVTFIGGRKYIYQGVPVSVIDELRFSGSIGKYINTKIKPKYNYVPVTQDLEGI